ncbi:MAG: ABC1 kinase family protein [Leptolyngbyaceae cyanobacterium]
MQTTADRTVSSGSTSSGSTSSGSTSPGSTPTWPNSAPAHSGFPSQSLQESPHNGTSHGTASLHSTDSLSEVDPRSSVPVTATAIPTDAASDLMAVVEPVHPNQTDTDPIRYDPEEITQYYGDRPLEVWGRIFSIFWPMLMFAVSILWDRQTGQLKTNQRKRAIQMRDLITRLGPAYIKVGQALSTRPDLVPAEYLDELSRLQDQIPPFPNEVAYQFIEEELGQHPSEIYAELSEDPIAAASLGQVYKGKLKSGEAVAVKVQRPDLREQIALDVYILRQLSSIAQRLVKQIRSDLVGIMDEFGARIFEEMDYVNEGCNAEKFERLYGHLQDIYIPKIYWAYTNRRVLTMEWISGVKLTQPERVREQGVDAGYLVEMGVQCSLRQLLEHGFFHADPHPGNLLATKEGKLAYLDFGMMSEVKPQQRYGLLEAVVHLVNRDFDGLAHDYVKLEFLTPDVDLTPIIPAFANVFGDALGASVASLNFKSITDQLSDLMYEYPFRVPAYYALIIRSLVTLEGIAIKVDPEFKVLSKAYPYVAKRLLTDEAPELRASLQDLLFKDGSFRWNRLENLLRNASNSQDYDLNLILGQTIDFIFSERGEFIRERLTGEIVHAADDFGRTSWQRLVFSVQNPGQSYSVPTGSQASNSNFQHIIRILEILRDTPGFDPMLIVNLVPKLLSKAELQYMGLDIANQLVQRSIARFIREFFLNESRLPDDEQREGAQGDRRSLPSASMKK